ncbi:MAG: flagellar brake protein [Treponema sp.]|nr:flagellar brake protein [Treponema sp.]
MFSINRLPIHFYPLQLPTFYKETNPEDAVIFIIGVVVIVVILVTVNVVKNRYNIPALGGARSSGSGPRRFSGFALHRLADNIGLDRDQSKMLEFVFKTDSVADPERSINSPTLLDRHFKHAYHVIERSANTDDEAQERLSLLFSTRNLLEANSSGGGAASTRQLPENTAAVLGVGKDNYPVRVISTKGENLVIENPHNALGTPLRLPRGGKVILSFFTKSSKGFSFESRILGTADSADGPVLQLVHSNLVRRLSQRKFRRRQLVLPTNFYFVYVEDTGHKKGKKMVVDKRRLNGNILDISVGGCSMKTNVPVPSGTRLKIEFIHENGVNVAALGQVLRTNRTGISTIMHVKFLRIPRKSLNVINALVYEYVDG